MVLLFMRVRRRDQLQTNEVKFARQSKTESSWKNTFEAQQSKHETQMQM